MLSTLFCSVNLPSTYKSLKSRSFVIPHIRVEVHLIICLLLSLFAFVGFSWKCSLLRPPLCASQFPRCHPSSVQSSPTLCLFIHESFSAGLRFLSLFCTCRSFSSDVAYTAYSFMLVQCERRKHIFKGISRSLKIIELRCSSSFPQASNVRKEACYLWSAQLNQ